MVLRPALPAALALILAACVQSPGEPEAIENDETTIAPVEEPSDMTKRPTSSDPEQPSGDDPCGAKQAAQYVGQVADDRIREAIAGIVPREQQLRFIGPDTMVTQDYSPERLNVVMDENDVITEVRCG